MSELEKKIITALTAAVSEMPENKKEYFLGYAEAIADMKKAETQA